MVFEKPTADLHNCSLMIASIIELPVLPLSVVFRRTTTEENDKPDFVWYLKTNC
jgi:hypothetical protein